DGRGEGCDPRPGASGGVHPSLGSRLEICMGGLSQGACQPWVHRLDGSARKSLRQCQGREFHEDAEGRGRLFDELRNVRGCHRRSSQLHRRGLQHTQTTLSARLLEPRAIRGPLRSANGQNCRLILSSPRGALHAEAHERPPWTRRREVPPSGQRYSRASVRAVECSGGLRAPKDRGTIMLQGWIVIAFALGYIGLLFVVASYGDRTRRFGREGGWRHFIYPLSLAIYCTSWTFFGSVGLASRTGFDFLTIYVGPILLVGLCSPLIMRIVRLAKAQNITSIADFIAARYGKAQTVAATVALIAIIGTIPYIALQLKAVSSSLTTILVHIGPASGAMQPVLGDIALYVAVAMAIFAVLFGTRHIDATEHQDGLMLAIATESIVKLVAFVGVGVFVTFWM